MPFITASSAVSSAPLTFGVELEFVLYAHTCTSDQFRRIPRPDSLITTGSLNTVSSEAVFQLSAEMRKNGITVRKDSAGWDGRIVHVPAEDRVGDEWADTEMVVWDHEEVAAQTPDEDLRDEWAVPKQKLDENGWVVSFDPSVKPVSLGGDRQAECEAGIEWQGVEVVSKILTAGEESFKEVCNVSNLLNRTFRTEVNRSCGLHVHVGNGKEGFNLATLKNLVAALWVFDREIIRLHPRFRTASRSSTACRSFCAGVLGRFPRKGELERNLKSFYNAKTIRKLTRLVGYSKYQAYNFLNLSAGRDAWGVKDPEPCKETVEFRQHEATLDGGRVERWARFCVGIVQWAKNTQPHIMRQSLLDELERQKKGTGMKVWDLVGGPLGMPDDAKAFKEFILEKEGLKLERKQLKEVCEIFFGLRLDSSDLTDHTWGETPLYCFDSDDESEYGEELAYYGKGEVPRLEISDRSCELILGW